MTKIKLYTEQQIREMLSKRLDSSRIWLDDDLINSLTPIEFPSDEEINEWSKYGTTDYNKGYRDGIIWLLELIKQESK